MKFIVAILFATILAECYSAAITTNLDTSAVQQTELERTKKAASYGAAAPSYGGSSYSAPPCPKNYLFSCQPALQPVGCSQSYGGSAGAYSENMPQYVFPQPHFHQQYEPLIREVY
uniref:VM domain-containing protein n=1 Tax=Megaselia scalaris TaxID=36166 RepID=T1H313_MEGSC